MQGRLGVKHCEAGDAWLDYGRLGKESSCGEGIWRRRKASRCATRPKIEVTFRSEHHSATSGMPEVMPEPRNLAELRRVHRPFYLMSRVDATVRAVFPQQNISIEGLDKQKA